MKTVTLAALTALALTLIASAETRHVIDTKSGYISYLENDRLVSKTAHLTGMTITDLVYGWDVLSPTPYGYSIRTFVDLDGNRNWLPVLAKGLEFSQYTLGYLRYLEGVVLKRVKVVSARQPAPEPVTVELHLTAEDVAILKAAAEILKRLE